MKTKIFAILLIASCGLHAQTGRGRVQIQNGTLVTDRGTLLRGAYDGMSQWTTLSPHELVTQIKALGLNCFHFYAEGALENFVGENQDLVDSIVQWTRQDSLYLILTLSEWSSDLGDYTFPIDFWRHYAERYKDETHVIYEIANEAFFPDTYPFLDTCDSLTMAMERAVYDTIRKYAPDTHIQFMSYPFTHRNYNFMDDIHRLGEGIDWSNASIAAHGYTNSAEDNRTFIRNVQDSGYAITITEVPVIWYTPGVPESYANLAFIRMLEQEEVSYCNFLTPVHLMDPKLYKSQIENSEIRWEPDFGTWPNHTGAISYKNPYTPMKLAFADECTYGTCPSHKFEMLAVDFAWDEQSYVTYYNVDFEEGPDSIILEVSFVDTLGWIEFHLDSLDGQLVANCPLSPIPDSSRKKYIFPVSEFSGVHHLYMYFRSNYYTYSVLSKILFVKAGTNTDQLPFYGQALELPGKIEAEDFDYGFRDASYFDIDNGNNGQYYRNTDVDIFGTADIGLGHSVGYEVGEWLEYTVNSSKESLMNIQFRYAILSSGNSIKISLDQTELGVVELPINGSWADWVNEAHSWYSWPYWSTVTLDSIVVPAGNNQILKVEFLGDYGGFLNWIDFVELETSSAILTETNKRFTVYPNPANDLIHIEGAGNAEVELFTLHGQLLKRKALTDEENTISVIGLPAGQYIIRIKNKNRIFSDLLIINNR